MTFTAITRYLSKFASFEVNCTAVDSSCTAIPGNLVFGDKF